MATEIKCAVLSAFVSLAFASQAPAVLRPLFPIKPAAPSNGELIIIGDDSVLGSTENAGYINRRQTLKSVPGQSAMAF